MKKYTSNFLQLIVLLLAGFSANSQKIQFNAKAIIALSDADMVASTFADGKLMREKGSKDQFSVIKFPVERSIDEVKSVIASNSVLNGLKSLVIAPNNKLAYVVETHSVIPENINDVKNVLTDLPAGGFVTVVDISDISQPKLLYKFPTGRNPIALDIDKSGQYLAICTEEYGKELQVLELDATGKPMRIINKPQNFPLGKVSDVTWHPDGEHIAFTFEESREVGLIKVSRDGPTTRIIRLDLVGKPTRVGNYPGAGKFTPDGSFYIIPDLKKGSDAQAEAGFDGKCDIYLMKFKLDGSTEHSLYSRAKVGENIGDFAISPDGNLIVVSNTNKSFYPWNDSKYSPKSSLSLLKITDGKLEKVEDYDFEGILPENIAFDEKGENIAVAIYEYPYFGKHFGGIDFWKVTKGDKPALQKQDIKLFLPRGCHALKVVK